MFSGCVRLSPNARPFRRTRDTVTAVAAERSSPRATWNVALSIDDAFANGRPDANVSANCPGFESDLKAASPSAVGWMSAGISNSAS